MQLSGRSYNLFNARPIFYKNLYIKFQICLQGIRKSKQAKTTRIRLSCTRSSPGGNIPTRELLVYQLYSNNSLILKLPRWTRKSRILRRTMLFYKYTNILFLLLLGWTGCRWTRTGHWVRRNASRQDHHSEFRSNQSWLSRFDGRHVDVPHSLSPSATL